VTSLDLAGLVLVAGRALDLDEASVVAVADLEAAASVLARPGEAAGGPERQAATLVHGLVTRRVFGPRSGEVALLAALPAAGPARAGRPPTWGRRRPCATCWPAWPAAGSASRS
jgi:hypothetical protein